MHKHKRQALKGEKSWKHIFQECICLWKQISQANISGKQIFQERPEVLNPNKYPVYLCVEANISGKYFKQIFEASTYFRNALKFPKQTARCVTLSSISQLVQLPTGKVEASRSNLKQPKQITRCMYLCDAL